MCLGYNSQISFFFCFVYLVGLTYSFHDSSYIKRLTLSGGGHKFFELACYLYNRSYLANIFPALPKEFCLLKEDDFSSCHGQRRDLI